MELETLASDINDITMEANSTDDVIESSATATSEANEPFIDTSLSEDDIILEAQKILEERQNSLNDTILAAPVLRAGGSVTFLAKDDLIYTINFNGTEYRVLFPENMSEYLVERDGILINLYTSNITGCVLSNDDSLSTTTYHARFITLVPFTSTGGNSNAYRYGSFSYLTTYSPYSSTQLNSTTEYGNMVVVQKPATFRGFSSFELIIMACAALIVITNFFGGIFRR